jgi:hypothetical protein
LTDHIFQHEEEEPAPPEKRIDDPEIAQVCTLAQTLAKAVKAFQLYPAENPMCVNFGQEFFQQVTQAFQIADVIRLSVGKSKLFYRGETVLEQEGRDDSVPGRLFWSGIREVAFHVGLTREESFDFLSLFRTSAQRAEGGEDDFVTLLWEGRFEHLTMIAIDDILDLEDDMDPIPEEFGSEFMNFVDLEMYNLDDEDTERRAQEMAQAISAKMKEETFDLFGISQEEWDALHAEVARDESPEVLGDIIHLIQETLHNETEEESFVELLQILTGGLLGLMGEGRLGEASQIVRMVIDLRDHGEEKTPAMKAAVEAGLVAAWDSTRRQVLTQHLDSGRRTSLDTLGEFVDAVPGEAIEPLCEVLGNLGNATSRRLLTDALAKKAEEDAAPFFSFLRDHRSALVCNVASILGRARSQHAVGRLKELLRHSDFLVRREALSALRMVAGARAVEIFSEALFDPDPRIRMDAARNLGMVGRGAIPVLLTAIEVEGFDARPLSEKRSFYEALGYAGGEEMLPLMKKTLKRKNLFRRTQTDEIRACACEALGWIGGSEARRLLGEHAKDRSVLVRTAAQSGLRRIASGKQEPLIKEAA